MQKLNALRNSSNDRTRLLTRTFELLAFALLLPLAGLLFFPDNPTGLSSGVPWVAAAPLVFAARYGSVWGVSCAVVMAAFINLPLLAYVDTAGAHLALGVGTVALCLILGDVSNSTAKRYKRAEAENSYLRHRLKAFSTDYHVLRVSHGQLEEFMAGQHLSLRDALQKLKTKISDSNNMGLSEGKELMGVFSQFCSIQIAGLYTVSDNGMVEPQPVVTHGLMPELSLFDPVLRLALSNREMVSIRHEAIRDKHQSHALLAVVPLVDTEGRLHGVLAIRDMHFMAFQQQNLNILALLGNYVGNLLTQTSTENLTGVAGFLSEIETCLVFAKEHNTQSVMVSLQFEPSEEGEAVASFVCDGIRSLDASWKLSVDSRSPVVCLLFPLMAASTGQAFLQRLDKAVLKEFGIQLSHIMQDSQMKLLTAKDTMTSCKVFFRIHTDNSDAVASKISHRGLDGVA